MCEPAMLERFRMPLIFWISQAEYSDLIGALSVDPHFHQVLSRVVRSHSENKGDVLVTLTQEDAAQIVSDLDITDFDNLGDVLKQIGDDLETFRRNDEIYAGRFALPQVGSFFGD